MKSSTPDVLLDWLRQRDARALRESLTGPAFNTVPMDRLDAFERDLRQLVGAIRTSGAVPVLLAHQNRFRDTSGVVERRWLRAWERFYPNAPGRVILEFDRLAGERTAQVAADSGALFVDPASVFESRTTALFADFSHFTDEGAGRLAGAVASRLRQSPSCGPTSVTR